MFLRYARKTKRSPGESLSRNTSLVPYHKTSEPATAVRTSIDRSRLAASRLAFTSCFQLFVLCLLKASLKTPPSERACTVLIALMVSAAIAAMAPSRLRCFRATSWICGLSVTVRSQKNGNTSSATKVSFQLSQNIKATILQKTRLLATIGRTAVTTTSCSMPTSLTTRTTRSPVFAFVWNDKERYWRCR